MEDTYLYIRGSFLRNKAQQPIFSLDLVFWSQSWLGWVFNDAQALLFIPFLFRDNGFNAHTLFKCHQANFILGVISHKCINDMSMKNGTFDKISLSAIPDALRLPCYINPSHFTVLTNQSLCSWSACCMTHAKQVGDKMEERRFSWWHAMRWQISQRHKKNSRQGNPLWYRWQGLNMKIVLENLQQPFCVKSIRWERIFFSNGIPHWERVRRKTVSCAWLFER